MNSKKRSASDAQDLNLQPLKLSRSRNTSPISSLVPQPPRLPPETPVKQGSASASVSKNQLTGDGAICRSRTKRHHLAVTSENTTQSVVSHLLKSELNGAVWHDPHFLNKCSCGTDKLAVILDRCQVLNTEKTQWVVDIPQGKEENFYAPILRILNAIGRAAHSTGGEYVQFVDRSDRLLASDYSGMDTYPDIIWCERSVALDKVHWHDLDMFVEVKKEKTLATQGIQQSARYARALFANRLDRRFIDTIVICGTTAVFLHFDRSGLVYSDDVDIYGDTLLFLSALTGLLLRRDANAGYNPMFTKYWREEPTSTSKLAYRVTIQENTYDVKAVLCHRKAIRSRATLALGLRLYEPQGDTNKPIDVVLKLIWRGQTRFREGLILFHFVGMYGMCQLIYEGDVVIGGVLDVVYSRNGLDAGNQCDVFGPGKHNVDIKGAQQDHRRVHTQVVMQPGRPLWEATDAFELTAGMVGALMGHWALVTSQVQHRDIGATNILLTAGEFKYKRPEWEKLAELGVEQCAEEFRMPRWSEIFNEPDRVEYREVNNLQWSFDPKRRLTYLKRVIKILGRSEPFGFLSDLDMANILALVQDKPSDMHTHQTGTLSFMAVNLLLAKPTDYVPHTYLHDLKSFFWVLLYIVAGHRERGAPLTENALDVLFRLNQLEGSLLGDSKLSLLMRIAEGSFDISLLKTSWARSLAPLLREFALWLDRARRPTFDSASDPNACFEAVLAIFLNEIPKLAAQSAQPAPQPKHSCTASGECSSSCPFLDRPRDAEPLISHSSKGSSDHP
ncbi:hypothetical protein FRC07_003800 [Ceratobasidium sp. 392]|nr:hypothetical protein FRC07_003800 [Ceratobasidium sp. 392]